MKKSDNINAKERLFTGLQYLLPQHCISRLVGMAGDCKCPQVKNALIRWWIKKYNVPMDEAIYEDINAYQSFNDFFTRSLKQEARTFPEEQDVIISPVDGTISQLGEITSGRIFQAKGFDFSVHELCGGDESLAETFHQGLFSTIYLSPRDYHGVHMPCTGKLRKMIYVPGKLFSVNPICNQQIPRLFARNERLVCLFDTEYGPMAIVMVGACIVASIETVWAGEVTPVRRKLKIHDYTAEQQSSVILKRGDEMGCFKLGSTVIVLFSKDSIHLVDELSADSEVRLGQSFAYPVDQI